MKYCMKYCMNCLKCKVAMTRVPLYESGSISFLAQGPHRHFPSGNFVRVSLYYRDNSRSTYGPWLCYLMTSSRNGGLLLSRYYGGIAMDGSLAKA